MAAGGSVTSSWGSADLFVSRDFGKDWGSLSFLNMDAQSDSNKKPVNPARNPRVEAGHSASCVLGLTFC